MMDVFLYDDPGNDVILSDPLELRGGEISPWEITGVGGIESMEMFGFPFINRIYKRRYAKIPTVRRMGQIKFLGRRR